MPPEDIEALRNGAKFSNTGTPLDKAVQSYQWQKPIIKLRQE